MKKLVFAISATVLFAACNSSSNDKKKVDLSSAGVFKAVDTINVKTPEDVVTQYTKYLEIKKANAVQLTEEPKVAIEELAYDMYFQDKRASFINSDRMDIYNQLEKTLDSLREVYK